MTDAPEQAQAAEAPETAAADNAAAQEISAPDKNPQQQAETEINNLSDLDKLADSLLSEDAGDPAAPKGTEKPTESTTEEVTPPKQDELETKPPVDRVRLTSLNDKDKAFVNTAVQMVKDGLATDINEAIAKLSAKTAPQQEPEQTTEVEATPPVNTHAQTIETKQAEIAEVLKQLTQAKKDFDDEKETELTDKLTDLKTDIKILKFRQEQEDAAKEQTHKEAYDSQYENYRTQAVDLYPDAAVPGTDLFDQIQLDVAWFEKNNPAIFDTPNYPLLIAASAAARIGQAPKFATQAPAQPAAAATPSPNAKVAARPVNPLVGGSATTVSSDTKSAARQVESIRSSRDLDALADAVFAGR